MNLIESTGVNLDGAQAAVMGRSVLVGAPIATLLANAGATVNSLHSRTKNGPYLTRQADILVVATGVHQLVRGDHIKPGAVVIDVGIHRYNNKLSGDVVFDEAVDVAGHITPVPGGGPNDHCHAPKELPARVQNEIVLETQNLFSSSCRQTTRSGFRARTLWQFSWLNKYQRPSFRVAIPSLPIAKTRCCPGLTWIT